MYALFAFVKFNMCSLLKKIFLSFLLTDLPGATWKDRLIAFFARELSAHLTPKRATASLTLGVFIGLLPIYGLQLILLFSLCLMLRLNRPLAFLGVNVSTPPLLLFIIAAAIGIGKIIVPFKLKQIIMHIFLGVHSSGICLPHFIRSIANYIGETVVPLPIKHLFSHASYPTLISGIVEWFFGSIVIAIVCAFACAAICYPVFVKLTKNNSKKKSSNGV